MLPFSINTFWSLTQALSTFLRVLVARVTPTLTASSKLFGEVALSSVTRATVMCSPFFHSPLQTHYPAYRPGKRPESRREKCSKAEPLEGRGEDRFFSWRGRTAGWFDGYGNGLRPLEGAFDGRGGVPFVAC